MASHHNAKRVFAQDRENHQRETGLRKVQQKQQDIFELIRQGRMNDLIDPELRRERWGKLKVPKPGRWGGLESRYKIDGTDSAYDEDPMDGARRFNYRKPMVQIVVDGKALKRSKNVAKGLDPMGLSFNRILGSGAHGVAVLFDIKDVYQNQSTPTRVVVKTSLNPEDPQNGRGRIDQEKKYHKLLRHASHIVQSIQFQSKPKTPNPRKGKEISRTIGKRRYVEGSPTPAPKRLATQASRLSNKPEDDLPDYESSEEDRSPNAKRPRLIGLEPTLRALNPADINNLTGVLVLEHLVYGTLETWIGKMNKRRQAAIDRAIFNDPNDEEALETAEEIWFSSKQLWIMASCLFKSIVAMAHPPSLQKNFDENDDDSDETVPAPGRGVLSQDLVHFDIDPSNVLVGGFEYDEHRFHDQMPILKLGDFGIMEEMRDAKANDKYKLWSVRSCGKLSYYTPEQFTEEWDYIHGYPQMAGAEVAGRYGWKTNLYQFGLLLWTLITGCFPLTTAMQSQVIDVEYEDDGSEKYIWSYGTYLRNKRWRHVDRALRELVVDCLKDNPDHRPSLRTVENTIKSNLNVDWDDEESAEETRAWAESFFVVPPNPKAHPGLILYQWMQSGIEFSGLLDDALNEEAEFWKNQMSPKSSPGKKRKQFANLQEAASEEEGSEGEALQSPHESRSGNREHHQKLKPQGKKDTRNRAGQPSGSREALNYDLLTEEELQRELERVEQEELELRQGTARKSSSPEKNWELPEDLEIDFSLVQPPSPEDQIDPFL